jgi:hypothetical protein
MPCGNVRIYGEVTFNHKILPQLKTSWLTSPSTVTVTGHLDYGIDCIIKYFAKAKTQSGHTTSNPSW